MGDVEVVHSLWFLLFLVPFGILMLIQLLTYGRRGRRWSGVSGMKNSRGTPLRPHLP